MAGSPRVTPLVKKRSKPTWAWRVEPRSEGSMPRIDGRAIGRRLLLIGRVAQSIVKGVVESAVVSDGSKIEFADGIADAVAGIGGAVGVAGVGRLGHPDAHETHSHRSR